MPLGRASLSFVVAVRGCPWFDAAGAHADDVAGRAAHCGADVDLRPHQGRGQAARPARRGPHTARARCGRLWLLRCRCLHPRRRAQESAHGLAHGRRRRPRRSGGTRVRVRVRVRACQASTVASCRPACGSGPRSLFRCPLLRPSGSRSGFNLCDLCDVAVIGRSVRRELTSATMHVTCPRSLSRSVCACVRSGATTLLCPAHDGVVRLEHQPTNPPTHQL